MSQRPDNTNVTNLGDQVVQIDILKNQTTLAICRCGLSDGPFCNGSHVKEANTSGVGPVIVVSSIPKNAN